MRNPAEPSVVTTVVTTLVAEPGGPGFSHQFFKKSKDPKGKALFGNNNIIVQADLQAGLFTNIVLLFFDGEN